MKEHHSSKDTERKRERMAREQKEKKDAEAGEVSLERASRYTANWAVLMARVRRMLLRAVFFFLVERKKETERKKEEQGLSWCFFFVVS